MNSFNHYAYGAVGEWLYRVVAGIEADAAAPGYKHIIFQPHTGGALTYVRGSYESVYGTVASEWEQNGEHVILTVKVPVNTAASVILEEGAAPEEDSEIPFVTEHGHSRAELGSGCYQIRYRKTI